MIPDLWHDAMQAADDGPECGQVIRKAAEEGRLFHCTTAKGKNEYL